jgi:hypothetical protein
MSTRYITVENSKLEPHSKSMVLSAIKAIDMLEAWDKLAKYSPPENTGFMFDDSPFMKSINSKIFELYDGHSGSSYGITMRHIEYIAKNGVVEYVANFN